MTAVPTLEILAQNEGWLRALIGNLVDDGSADDVMQRVRQQALKRPPADSQAWPAWLATVARRFVGRDRRTAARRERREAEAVARGHGPAAAEEPIDVVARVEGRQRVTSAVLSLEEPLRMVLLLRYYEDLQPVDIARRLEIPAATVRTRLHRARQVLRDRFATEHGEDWRGRLALLVAPLPAARTAGLSGSAVAAIVLATLAIGVGSYAWFGDPVSPEEAEDHTAVVEPEVKGPVAGTGTPTQREAVPNETQLEAVAPPPVVEGTRGVVKDEAGRPVPNVEIRFVSRKSAPRIVARSDAAGRYRIDEKLPEGWLATADRFAVVEHWTGHVGEPDILIVAPKIALTGVVVDASGAAVAGVKVRVDYAEVHGFPEPLVGNCQRLLIDPDHRGEPPLPETTTDAEGQFAFASVAAARCANICAWHPGSPRAFQRVPEHGDTHVRLVLRAPKKRKGTKPAAAVPPLRGIVTDANGHPLSGVVVADVEWGAMTESGEDGGFALHMSMSFANERTIAFAKAGHRPCTRRIDVRRLMQSGQRLRVALPLDGHALRGRILDAKGRPIAGLRVAVADPTTLGMLQSRPRLVERIDRDPRGAHGMTDATGSFEIPDVLDRAYRLRITDLDAGFTTLLDGVRPGVAVEHRLPPRTRRTLTLRLVDGRGTAVPGASVALEVIDTKVVQDTLFGTSIMTEHLDESQKAQTDASGRVTFENVPAGDLELELRKPGFVARNVSRFRVGQEPTLTVLRQFHFRVDTPDLDRAYTSIEFFDAAGEKLSILPPWRGARRSGGVSTAVHWGRSKVLGVPESAVRARLSFGDRVFREMAVALDPDPAVINVLRFPVR